MKKLIHVHVRGLAKEEPAIIVRSGKRSTRHRIVEIQGPSTLIHLPTPDHYGARVRLETTSPVLADGRILLD